MMVSQPFPDSADRQLVRASGAPDVGVTVEFFLDEELTVDATIFEDDEGAPGDQVASFVSDAWGMLPARFWGPTTGETVLWISANSGPATRVHADLSEAVAVLLSSDPVSQATLDDELDDVMSGVAEALSFKADTTALTSGLALRVLKSDFYTNVKDHGALGDGVADDTAEIQAAIDATPAGATVFFPPGRYLTSATLNLNNGQRLMGVGYYVNRDAVTSIGMDAGYLDPSMFSGSVIVSSLTNGNAIFHLKPTIHAGGSIQGLALIGPGSGTSVGLRAGQHTPTVRAVLAPVYRDVLIANFATGIEMHHVNEAELSSVLIKGCTKPVSLIDDANDITWTKLNIQRCTSGLIMESGGTCYANNFIGAICQNVTNAGFVVRGFSHVWSAPYFELCGAGQTGANAMMHFAGASNCTITSPQKQGAGTYTIDIANGSNFNHFLNLILSSTMLIANSGTGSLFTGNLDNGTRITGANNRVAVDLNSATYEVPSLSTTSGSRPSLQHTNFLARNGTGGQEIREGSGSPEGVVTAPAGSVYFRSNPANANEVIYVKVGSGNTGWTAK